MGYARQLVALACILLTFTLSACGGGGTSGSPPVPSAPSNANSLSVAVAQQGGSYALPASNGISGKLTLGTNGAPTGTQLTVAASNSAPTGITPNTATASNPFEYLAFTASNAVTFSSQPQIQLTFPSPPHSAGTFYAWMYDGTTWSDLGTVNVSGTSLTFGGAQTAFTFKAGTTYYIVPFTAPQGASCTSARLFTIGPTDFVIEYVPPYNGPPAKGVGIGGNPANVAVNSSGDLFVFLVNGVVSEYAPPYTGAPIASFATGAFPIGMAVKGSGDVFIATNGTAQGGQLGAGFITEFVPPYTGTPLTIPTVGSMAALAIDSSGDLFDTVNGVTEYAPPYTNGPKAVFPITAYGLAFDSSNDLFVSNINNDTVSEYAPPYTGAPIGTFTTNGATFSLAVDPSGDVFAAVDGGTGPTIQEFAPPYTGAPIATEPSGFVGANGVAVFP